MEKYTETEKTKEVPAQLFFDSEKERSLEEIREISINNLNLFLREKFSKIEAGDLETIEEEIDWIIKYLGEAHSLLEAYEKAEKVDKEFRQNIPSYKEGLDLLLKIFRNFKNLDVSKMVEKKNYLSRSLKRAYIMPVVLFCSPEDLENLLKEFPELEKPSQ